MLTDPRSRRCLAILLVGLLGVGLVNIAADATTERSDSSLVANLLDPPAEDGVWIVGNSIFKTGIDIDALGELVEDHSVDFEYHGGHYTSLWYLIARNALPELAPKPGIVVWGFRPNFALLPAFRQNRVNDTELFTVTGDRTYDQLAAVLTGPANPLDQIASDLHSWVAGTAIFEARDEAATQISARSLDLALVALRALRSDTAELIRTHVIDGEGTLLDLINSAVTGGEVELAEERVVDGVGDFVSGEPTRFTDGFVPVTAELIAAAGVDQLAVIWKPRAVADGRPAEADDEFVADAVAWFDSAGIPVLDLYHDARISIDLYADGDHFNPDGRDLVTAITAERLAELGYE